MSGILHQKCRMFIRMWSSRRRWAAVLVLNWDAFAQFMQRLIWKAASRKTAVEANEGSSKCVDWFSRSACERHFQIDFAYVG